GRVVMPIAVTLALLVFWLVIAYRQYQRGDMLLAGVFLFVGIALTVWRIRQAQSRSQTLGPSGSQNPNSNPNPPNPPGSDGSFEPNGVRKAPCRCDARRAECGKGSPYAEARDRPQPLQSGAAWQLCPGSADEGIEPLAVGDARRGRS